MTPSGGGTQTVTVTQSGGATQTETVTVTPTGGSTAIDGDADRDRHDRHRGGVGVLPTKIGNNGSDTGVLGTKTGVLAATGLDLPMGAALGLSFALLLAGGALMVLPSRLAVERTRRH